ncbi:sulfotransferase 1 family member D1-like [Musca vetustissima]|uniref:sulfotransferase 1 family member D1-like n=1 Tax=Musca vetustissima TaxID=27455 RepID=UPI002AB7ADA0|nr:sulfotransferase 1 family member D1-like [Musca vetustissima]
MLKSRSISAPRVLFPSKQYATDGKDIPYAKNWSETWCTLSQEFDIVLPDILNMEIRSDDVFVVTFIKCGTTWMQEAAWLLMNNLDFEKSKAMHVWERSPFLDNHGFNVGAPNAIEYCKTAPSPRVIKTHMPANLLPLEIWKKKVKTIYVARNCKDVVVSSYHFLKNLRQWLGDNIEDFVTDFLNDEIYYSNYWTHIVDFWKMRNEEHIFFVTYEEMKRDLGSVIKRLCTFLGRPQLSEEEMQKILDYLSFNKMKDNDKTNITTVIKETIPNVANDFQFMRRGVVGSFKDELTPELQAKIDDWSRKILSQYGLTEEDIFGKL